MEQALARIQRKSGPEAEASGDSLVGMVARDEYAGLGGRTLLTLTKQDRSQPLPWNRLGVGTPVLLSDHRNSSAGWLGVVSERSTAAIQVALGFSPLSQRLFDAVSLGCVQRRGGQAAAKGRVGAGTDCARRPSGGAAHDALGRPSSIVSERSGMDATRRVAQRVATAGRRIRLVGRRRGRASRSARDGKNHYSDRGDPAGYPPRSESAGLAPSNLAVDNLLERLLAAGETRAAGTPRAASCPSCASTRWISWWNSIPMCVWQTNCFAIHRPCATGPCGIRVPSRHRGETGNAQRPTASEDARRLENQVMQQVLDRASVICATTTALDSEILGQRTFDLLVIDEACQSTEPPCWIPLSRCQRVVLAGDHCQLPPPSSRWKRGEGLGVSLMERLVELYDSTVARQLTVQYRMHEQIMRFSSEELYQSSLIAHLSVEQHRLSDLPAVKSNNMTDTRSRSSTPPVPATTSSWSPMGRAVSTRKRHCVQNQVRAAGSGVAPTDIAVITPYAAQVCHLREQLLPWGIDVDTVDGFQGREKEAVVISLVRSNSQGEIGFLADTRRTNVALTRARRKLIVIGDSATIGAHPFYQRLLEYFERQNAYRTVWEMGLARSS